MLRNRSSKQVVMADYTSSLISPTKPTSSPISSFLNGFLTKTFSDSETSPTSILDIKNSPPPFKSSKREAEAIGLALIGSIIQEKNDGDFNFSKPINRMILLGSKLKVQIPDITPPCSAISPIESPKSPAEFGIKTRNSQVLSPFTSGTNTPCRDFSRQLSLKEMELSEDYTCVTTHGPNPKTTHIFDDCVVECCCGDDDHDDGKKLNSECDLCAACKDILGQGK